MVDTHASGACERKLVQVQVLSSAVFAKIQIIALASVGCCS